MSKLTKSTPPKGRILNYESLFTILMEYPFNRMRNEWAIFRRFMSKPVHIGPLEFLRPWRALWLWSVVILAFVWLGWPALFLVVLASLDYKPKKFPADDHSEIVPIYHTGWTQEDQDMFIKDLRELTESWEDSDDPEEVSKFADRAMETTMQLLEIYELKTEDQS